MSEQTKVILIIFLLFILLAVISLYGSNIMFKRAMRKVLKMFRDHEALSAERASYADELGMKKRGFMPTSIWRDYTPHAIDLLIKNDIVKVTEEGKLFLSEEKLAASGLEARIDTRKK